jgi:DNA-binding response OmpR family regulator
MNLDNCVRFGDVTVRMPELQVCFRGREIHLTLTQLRLLMIFLSDPFGRFSSAELVRRAQLPSKPALNVLITNLRALLDQEYIRTLHGFGYAFMVEK